VRARLLRTAFVLLLIAVVGVASSRTSRLVDLTAERSVTLTAQTQRVLDQLDRDVQITAFLRRDEPGRVEAAALLDRYAKAGGRVDWEVLDPDEAPGLRARLGVDPVFGGVAVRSGERVEVVATVTEQDVTAALARLARGRDEEVCVTTGHGEPELRAASALLEQEGYRVRILDLLVRPQVPPSCTAVVVAGATEPLGDAVDALAAWLDDDGRLLVLTDPLADVDVSRLLSPYGLGVQRGIVFEGDPEGVIAGDVTSPVVRTYRSGHPVVRRLAPTYFPAVQGIDVQEEVADRVAGLTVSRLADTSPQSYLETAPVQSRFDPGIDLAGPVTVAAAAERTRNDGRRIGRTRVVVAGDVDFATDRFLGEAANAALLTRAVAWLTLDEELLALSPNLPAERPLGLSDARLTYARVLTAGVVPALFLLLGAMVWAARRGR
jgi:ABC-type uncharacterized transport system involved in gliding motility auxiliary subunit